MRFPKVPSQRRAFDLFKYLGLSNDQDPKENKLIPYIMSDPHHDILHFNGIGMTVTQYEASDAVDPFNTQTVNPKEAYARFNAVIEPFKQALRRNFDEGWEKLMKADRYSMRAYLSIVENFSDPVRELRWSI
jgi:hypothetical protein